MAPLELLFGANVQNMYYPYIKPTITSIAAGTFIYLSTLHSLDRLILIKDCRNTKEEYTFVIINFTIIAIIAI
ncbi:hypothetical protein fh0823_05230 [Francisella halioticida]|uniref:Uncharacterized protein n=1 Tax=Francisella halioticida TaxID=549298 RepID=A0ABN5AVY5_9GAMM|nr:hypothetical protein [Francisella halioticida]ASG68051.1 hypothetical protein CDV26_06325 [Francisella halioticida]BCD90384.1 hypothetical protein fh0823_05230 [Francisella halioticida]